MPNGLNRYAVISIDAKSGETSTFLYAASSAEEARALASRHGFIVEGVALIEAEFGGVPVPPSHQPALARRRRRNQRSHGLADFFNFRSFIFPELLRALFALATAIAFVVLPMAIVWRANHYPPFTSSEWGSVVVGSIAVILSWLGLRIVFELWILLFRISEQIGEVIKLQRSQR